VHDEHHHGEEQEEARTSRSHDLAPARPWCGLSGAGAAGRTLLGAQATPVGGVEVQAGEETAQEGEALGPVVRPVGRNEQPLLGAGSR